MVLATTLLTGFSGETIWPLGQLRLLVTIGDTKHYTKACMNFMIVRSPSPYNGIIGRPGVREIQAVPCTAHGMLKFLVNGRIVTIRSIILTPTECTTIVTTSKETEKKDEARHGNFKVAIHLVFSDQEITIGGTTYHDQLPSIDSISKKDIPLSSKKKRGHAPERAKAIQLETPDAKQAFKQLKQHLAELPMLVAPKHKEELIMYLFASYGVISAVLMTERDTIQTLVYFVSRALQDHELNYTSMEKLVLALVCAAKRLHRYFQAHPIVVITDQPIKQILADFLVEKSNDAPPEASMIETSQELYTLFTDRSSCVDGSSVGLILTCLEGTEFTYALRFQFTTSNNEAEYEALIASLRIATQMGVRNVQVLVEILKEKSIQEKEMATVVEEEGPTWMAPIIEYLRDGTLPKNHKEASKLCIKARQYELLEGILYRRSFLKPWLRSVGPLQADYVIREIYEGSYSMHAGPQFVVAKAMRSWYPQQPLTPITASWPFYKWGIDIAGLFLKGLGKVKFLIVAMDYFTKWIKAKAVATINGSQVKNFRFASVKHPQSNGLIETENQSLGEGIKARLGERNKNWLKELPHVLWAHRMMIKLSNDDTSFSLTYGTEAVIPAEIKMPTYRTAVVDVVHNDEERRLNLDLLKERRARDNPEAWSEVRRTLRGHKSTRRWSIQAKIYRRDGPPKDVEHRQSQKVLPLSHDSCMEEFALQLGLVIK
nr:reverse transcriptase domain-containing protein [Tanacetum cinerariifolium]